MKKMAENFQTNFQYATYHKPGQPTLQLRLFSARQERLAFSAVSWFCSQLVRN